MVWLDEYRQIFLTHDFLEQFNRARKIINRDETDCLCVNCVALSLLQTIWLLIIESCLIGRPLQVMWPQLGGSNRCHYREHMDCGWVDPLWTSSRSLDVRSNVKWSPRWVLSSSTSFWLRIQAGVQLHAMRNDCLPPCVILSPPPTPHLPSSFVTSSLRRDAVQNQSSSPPTLEKVNTASSIPRQLLFIEQINI